MKRKQFHIKKIKRSQPIQLAVEQYLHNPSQDNGTLVMEACDKYLWKFIHSFHISRKISVDIIQDLRLTTWKSLQSYSLKHRALFTTYIHKALLGTIQKAFNKEIDRSKFETDEVPSFKDEDQNSALWEDLDENIDLSLAVNNLSEPHKSVLFLLFFKDKRIRDVANMLHLKVGDVDRVRNEALEKLRITLDNN